MKKGIKIVSLFLTAVLCLCFFSACSSNKIAISSLFNDTFGTSDIIKQKTNVKEKKFVTDLQPNETVTIKISPNFSEDGLFIVTKTAALEKDEKTTYTHDTSLQSVKSGEIIPFGKYNKIHMDKYEHYIGYNFLLDEKNNITELSCVFGDAGQNLEIIKEVKCSKEELEIINFNKTSFLNCLGGNQNFVTTFDGFYFINDKGQPKKLFSLKEMYLNGFSNFDITNQTAIYGDDFFALNDGIYNDKGKFIRLINKRTEENILNNLKAKKIAPKFNLLPSHLNENVYSFNLETSVDSNTYDFTDGKNKFVTANTVINFKDGTTREALKGYVINETEPSWIKQRAEKYSSYQAVSVSKILKDKTLNAKQEYAILNDDCKVVGTLKYLPISKINHSKFLVKDGNSKIGTFHVVDKNMKVLSTIYLADYEIQGSSKKYIYASTDSKVLVTDLQGNIVFNQPGTAPIVIDDFLIYTSGTTTNVVDLSTDTAMGAPDIFATKYGYSYTYADEKYTFYNYAGTSIGSSTATFNVLNCAFFEGNTYCFGNNSLVSIT